MGCSPSVPVLLNNNNSGSYFKAIAIANAMKLKHVKQILPDNEITENQIRLVRCTWNYLSNNMLVDGTKVFLRIFELNPRLKRLFPFRYCTTEALVKNRSFQDHVVRFMQAVGSTVDNLDHLDSTLGPLLVEIGKQHINFSGFKPGYFEAFWDGMKSVLKEELMDNCTKEVEDAWNAVFAYIMKCLQSGYQAATYNAVSMKSTCHDIAKVKTRKSNIVVDLRFQL